MKTKLGFPVTVVAVDALRARASPMVSRWGHAATYIPSPSSLLITGGRTAPSADSGHTSSPNTADAFFLPLNASFSTGSPPWQAIPSPVNAPDQSWFSLSPLSSSGDIWTLLSFGGDETGSPTPSGADSAFLVTLNTVNASMTWTQEAAGWANQPARRIYHTATCASGGGKVYITGGLKDDGSNQVFTDTYAFDPATPIFSALPPLPQSVFHHVSVLLPNGTLVVLGGAYHSVVDDNPAVTPLTSLMSLDTRATSPVWITVNLAGAAPVGRRGATATLSSDGVKLVLYGGADGTLSTAFNDMWSLDLAGAAWSQLNPGGQGAGGRFDHSAMAVGGHQILVFGGWRGSQPADADTWIYNVKTNQWTESFSADPPFSQPPPSSSLPTSSSSLSASRPIEPVTSVSDGRTVVSTPSAGPNPPIAPERPHGASPLSTAQKIAVGVSALAIAGLLLSILILCIRRRRRTQAKARAAAWKDYHERRMATGLGTSSGPSYEPSIEKGTAGLLDPGHPDGGRSPANEKPLPLLGFGMAAALPAMESLSKAFRSKRLISNDHYAKLKDAEHEQQDLVVPVRRMSSTRQSKYKLFGPRSPSRLERSGPANRKTPVQKATLITSGPSIHSTTSRVDMLKDEDTRRFSMCQEETEEDDAQINKEGEWHSARSLIGTHVSGDAPEEDDGNPFDDDISPERSRLILGVGPIPSPGAGESYGDPFADTTPHHTKRMPVISRPLAVPPHRASSYDDLSIPRSDQSRVSTVLSDPDPEAAEIVRASRTTITSPAKQHALLQRNDSMFSATSPVTQLSEQLDSAFSPSVFQTEWEPVRRSQSFLRRMTGGGVVGLFGLSARSSPGSGSGFRLDIRDPSPAPPLWNVAEERPPDGLSEQPQERESMDRRSLQDPSYSSLQSARSMRDITIAMRDPTDSSFVSIATSDERTEGDFADRGRSETFGPGTTPPHETMLSRDVPSAEADLSLMTPSRRSFASTSPHTRTPKSTSSVPAPSDPPTPSSYLSARRPVKDMVASINKRASHVPPVGLQTPAESLFSPVSKYSSAPPTPKAALPATAGQGGSPTPTRTEGRRSTLYEAVKREKLLVANPDKEGWR